MLRSLLIACLLPTLISVPCLLAAEPTPDKDGWKSLFDGKTLTGWKETDFAGHSEVEVEEGKIMLPFGSDMTGVTYTGKLPTTNYEVELDAMKVDGSDFFCGLTFMVGDRPQTLVCGGWGGGMTGISSLDGMDASENFTSSDREYKKGQWYHIRVRVTDDRVQAWVDKDEVANYNPKEHRLSIRSEVEKSKPLGIATYATTGAVKNIRIREIKLPEKK